MSIEVLRDWIIVIYGVLGILVLLVFTILVFCLYRRAQKTLDSIENISNNISTMVDTIKSEVVDPIIQFTTIFQGIKKLIETVSKFMKKE